MKGILALAIFMLSVSFLSTSKAQTVRDDGKITLREKRFINQRISSTKKTARIHEWKNRKIHEKAMAKNKRKNEKIFKALHENQSNWARRNNKRENDVHYKTMKKGWLARENPKEHVQETGHP